MKRRTPPELWRKKVSLSPRALHGLVGTQSTSGESGFTPIPTFWSRLCIQRAAREFVANELYAEKYSVLMNWNCQPAKNKNLLGDIRAFIAHEGVGLSALFKKTSAQAQPPF